MANQVITKQARRAAREAAAAAQEEVARRTRANVEALSTFFSARERAEAVDEWLAERQQVLRDQAAQRRREQRVVCGGALRSMRDRGESVREIARMAGIAEKTARELIREADTAAATETTRPPAAASGESAGRAGVESGSQRSDTGARIAGPNVALGERVTTGV